MTVSRRHFLAGSAALGLNLPPFLQRAALAAPRADQPGGEETVLVVVQLTGGNDGLNTVIPYGDPAYARLRPTLKQSPSRVLKIDDELGLHPAMSGMSKLLEDGRLSIVQGIGYPNATRSHFESMDVWHRATPDGDQKFGWLGRARAAVRGADAVFVGGGDAPLALYNATGHALAVRSLAEHKLDLGGGDRGRRTRGTIEQLVETGSTDENDLLAFARSTTQSMLQAEERFRRAAEETTGSNWPNTGLARRLKVVSQLLLAESPERIYYTSIDGFDTHSGQAVAHNRLLQEVSDAIAAFYRELESAGQHRRVLLATFSEFGRRVKENGSQGTDHGAGSQMFLVGEGLKSGPIGAHPSLTDLDRGDLKFHTDFRSVYRTLLDRWLKIPSEKVLDGEFPEVELFAKA